MWAAVVRALRTDVALDRRAAEQAAASSGGGIGSGGISGAIGCGLGGIGGIGGGIDGAGGGNGAVEAGMSELVDSVFYVLQRALRRAAHCCDPAICAAAVEHAVSLLTRRLLEHLQGQLKQSLSSKLAGAAAQAIVATADRTAGSFSGAAATAMSAEECHGGKLRRAEECQSHP
mmetsp:Transcript_36519/g.76906  ORF Transcript_36519/g.76906 Transcript_36519/m.76906 type:complete len:174 (+) Transcript_36519:116-637(+)